ncbi:hypothetical protein ABPG72_019915 [Tetrahymena utriculariae]
MDCLKDQNGIYCQNHPYHYVSFIKISHENTFELKCSECALNESCLNKYISIQTIRYCQGDHVFGNWPPVNNDHLLKDIKAILQVSSTLIEQIEFQFDKIVQEIKNFLTLEKKNIILQEIYLNQQTEKILQSYHQISDISKLKQLINFNQENIQSQINELKSFVSEFQNSKDKNTSILLEQITKIKEEGLLKYDFFKLQETTQGYLNNFTNKLKDLIYLRISPNICKLFGTFAHFNQSKSNQIEVQEDFQQQKISIKKVAQNGLGQVYFKYNQSKEKKYVVRWKFNDEAGDGINIGLTQYTNLNYNLNNTHLAKAFGNTNQFYGGKVVQGCHFFNVDKDKIIEMIIDINEEKLQFLDYPNYQNINELNDQYKLDKNETYYLALQFFSNSHYETCIDLIYFEELQS